MRVNRKRRLQTIFLMLIGIGVGVGLTLYALKQNINLFFTPSEVVAGLSPTDHDFRLGGMVETGSVKRDDLKVLFVLTDSNGKITVEFEGILPDLFREGQGIVTDGRMNNGKFIAKEVLAKHDANYMPPAIEKKSS